MTWSPTRTNRTCHLAIALLTGFFLSACGGDGDGDVGMTGPQVGSPSQLSFSTQPSSSAASEVIGPAIQVEIQDDVGNVVTSSSASVTLAIGTNPSDGTLWGTATVSAVNGVATFSNLSIDVAGTDYTLTATSSGLPEETSSAFDVTSAFIPGTNVANTISTCDDCTQSLNLGFVFQFYGTNYTSVTVSSNGVAAFVTGLNTFSNDEIPDPNGPNGYATAFWDDLHPSSGGTIYVSSVTSGGSQILIVEFRDVDFFGTGIATMNFEMIFREGSNEIQFVYGDSEFTDDPDRATGSSATIGIENDDGTDGLQVAFNEVDAIRPGLSMVFAYDGSAYQRVR